MPKFRSQEEYEAWRAQYALKRQRVRDLEKHDAEHPVYIAEKKVRIIGTGGLIALLLILAMVLYYTEPGRQFLGWVARAMQ
jgi:hypothetical protein